MKRLIFSIILLTSFSSSFQWNLRIELLMNIVIVNELFNFYCELKMFNLNHYYINTIQLFYSLIILLQLL